MRSECRDVAWSAWLAADMSQTSRSCRGDGGQECRDQSNQVVDAIGIGGKQYHRDIEAWQILLEG